MLEKFGIIPDECVTLHPERDEMKNESRHFGGED
jgi:hypothetical protein